MGKSALASQSSDKILLTAGRRAACSFKPSSCAKHLSHVRRGWTTAPRAVERVDHSRCSTIASHPSFERIDPTYLVEEETVRGYRPQHYYPVRLGEILHDRYKIIGKLGFGSASTVWLCRDLKREHDYVAVKVYINSSKYQRELPIYEEINDLKTTHQGQNYVRKMYESFDLEGPHGKHFCLVHQPLGISLGELKDVTPDGLFSAELTQQTMRCILSGLQFLHKDVRVIHTDLQPSNMLLGIHDNAALADFERYEEQYPCPRKELDDRVIYLSRPMPLTKGEPRITDLSEARFGDRAHTDRVMPNVYRAPEVILGLPWSYPVDVWGFGMVLWDLFQPSRLFDSRNSDGRYSEAHHLAQMIAIMGPPPLSFLQRCGPKAEQYWDKDGTWNNAAPVPDTNLEQMDQRLEGEEKARFLEFMRKMLRWDPEERHDCDALYWDEWLLADLIESGEVVREGQNESHSKLLFDVSSHGHEVGYQQPSERKRLAATQPSGRSPRISSKQSLASDASTFPAPLALPGDELSFDPTYPPQSFRSWSREKNRNSVTRQRNTIYVASPPEIANSAGFLRQWTRPHVEQEAQRPDLSDVVAYLQAFYHGMQVKLLRGTTLRFSAWDDREKATKSKSDQPAPTVGLETDSECIRISTRRYDDIYSGQLNLDDLLDVAIEILPPDAYALLMLVDHDLYEDDEDDFCCGRAYGGSRVAVVSSARYNPVLDPQHGIDRQHAWPASHCKRYIEQQCNSTRSKKPRTGIKQGQVQDSTTAMYAALAAHKACPPPDPGSATWNEYQKTLWLNRICKTACHELGHCLGIDHCAYYTCVMQGTASLPEDARQPPCLCSVDTAKVLRATGAEEVGRNEALMAYCERFPGDGSFAGFGAWMRVRNGKKA
ncbi:protein kinase [Teratosphaeria destructans]|uniref:Protein kinase n=1 Tax=Teratosphaeria destructans TaxID=418781 RepID=A0A9W7SL77_9PEZI|nr:protein kinase [Teratosphaeria destructans]